MGEDNGEKGVLRGVVITLTAVLGIMGAWAVWTQSTRFTWKDGERHEVRMARHEETDRMREVEYDEIVIRLTRIESLLRYNFGRSEDDKIGL